MPKRATWNLEDDVHLQYKPGTHVLMWNIDCKACGERMFNDSRGQVLNSMIGHIQRDHQAAHITPYTIQSKGNPRKGSNN